jgi:hypothetical protein
VGAGLPARFLPLDRVGNRGCDTLAGAPLMAGVCFASDEGFAGCIYSCQNAARVLGGGWAIIPREGDPPPAVLDADLLFLSSWHPSYEALLARRHGPVVPRWHSPVLQAELGDEQAKVARIVELLDRGLVQAIAVSDPELVPALDREGVVFFPEVLDQSEYGRVNPAPLRGVHVSLFGSADRRKNLLGQSAAFQQARRHAGSAPWTLHLNGQSYDDPRYEAWLATARVPYVDHGWMERAEYLSLVAAMDAGLCASVSESYCYVAADHVTLGVPIVASPAITCLGAAGPRARPERVGEIADQLGRALSARSQLAAEQRAGLVAQARSNAEAAQSALGAIESRLGLTAQRHPERAREPSRE